MPTDISHRVCRPLQTRRVNTAPTVVGYQTHDWLEQNEYFMMGANFESPTGDPLTLEQIDFKFENVPVYVKNTYQKICPGLQIAAATGTTLTKLWYVKDSSAEDATYSWRNGAGAKKPGSTIEPGMGFWFRDTCSDQPAYTMPGQVMPDVVWSKTFDGGEFIMLCNPYPVDVKLSDVTFENLKESAPVYVKNTFTKLATQFWVPNATGTTTTKLYFVKDSEAEDATYSWRTGAGAKKSAEDYVIPAGRGGWFKAAATAAPTGITVTFTNPTK